MPGFSLRNRRVRNFDTHIFGKEHVVEVSTALGGESEVPRESAASGGSIESAGTIGAKSGESASV